MMPEDLPNCICGAHDWQPGGGSFGGISQQGFQCNVCKRWCMQLSGYYCSCFISPTDPSADLGAFRGYLNDVLLVTFRTVTKPLETAQHKVFERYWENFRQMHNLPAEVTVKTIRDRSMQIRYPYDGDKKYTQLTKEEIAELPEESQRALQLEKLMDAAFDAMHKDKAYLRPEGFDRPPTPPQIPAGLRIHLMVAKGDKWEWELLKNEDTTDLDIPVDPILTGHYDYYMPVWKRLAEKYDLPFTDHEKDKRRNWPLNFREVTNEYCGAKNEPWWAFEIGEITFKVGPRKRVTNIEVKAPHGLVTSRLSSVAKADDTTYYANGGWHNWDKVVADSICVHAWTAEKLEEYLGILLEEALKVTP